MGPTGSSFEIQLSLEPSSEIPFPLKPEPRLGCISQILFSTSPATLRFEFVAKPSQASPAQAQARSANFAQCLVYCIPHFTRHSMTPYLSIPTHQALQQPTPQTLPYELHHIILYCTLLHVTVLYQTTLYSTALHSTVLHCTLLYLLHYTACGVLHCTLTKISLNCSCS